MLTLLLGVILIAGCSNGLARVEGDVSLDGEPVTGGGEIKATVFFHPSAGGPAAYGQVDSEGHYQLSTGSQPGVEPGDYVVTFTATRKVTSPEGGTPSGERISPTKYATPQTSGLNYQVEPGRNQIDLKLSSNDAG